MIETMQSLLSEPRAPDPPVRVRMDWVALVLLTIGGVVGAFVIVENGPWLAATVLLAFLLAALTLWRRVRPLAMVVLGCVIGVGVNVAEAMGSSTSQLTENGTAISESFAPVGLVLTYALGRWASGRAIAVGAAVACVSELVTSLMAGSNIGGIVFSLPVWMLPIAVGVLVRSRDRLRRQGIADARLAERRLLARELHDTVAHHVSAIAVQAQAGQAVAEARPDQAAEVLARIEAAASATLDEMRTMVGALRTHEDAEFAPQAGVAAIAGFATNDGSGPPVVVDLGGGLDDLSAPVGSALYRLAQESVTNATRHGRHATRIGVSVTRCGDHVDLTVTDDGDAPAVGRSTKGGGFGLVGMAERVHLLGGTFDAGPRPDRGWVVQASLPVAGPGTPANRLPDEVAP